MAEVLAGIDDIDWSSLTHAYGPATEIPRRLRAAFEGDAEAVEELDGSLYHQDGCVYSAAAAAMPFLVDLGCETAFAHAMRYWRS